MMITMPLMIKSDDDADGDHLWAALLVDQPLFAPTEPVPHQTLGHMHPVDVLRIEIVVISIIVCLQKTRAEPNICLIMRGCGFSRLEATERWLNRFLVEQLLNHPHRPSVGAREDVGGGQDLFSLLAFFTLRDTWMDITIPIGPTQQFDQPAQQPIYFQMPTCSSMLMTSESGSPILTFSATRPSEASP